MELNPAPAGLGPAGRELWQAAVEAFEFRRDQLTLLEQACLLADEVVVLSRTLEAAPVEVEGSQGQLRPNPLFAEVRAHRLALATMLRQLGLGDDAGETDGSARSHAARRLARLRWG